MRKSKKFNRYKDYSAYTININDENNTIHELFMILDTDILSNSTVALQGE